MSFRIYILVINLLGSCVLISQGLQVEENHTVLFGADTLGVGVKTMWIPSKAAFRTGAVGPIQVDGNNFGGNAISWDPDNIGLFSFATGLNSRASVAHAIALGLEAEATGQASVAIGYEAKSSGLFSVALGSSNASGSRATSMGQTTSATGMASVAAGINTLSSGISSFTMGRNNTAEGTHSLAVGDSTYARGVNSISMGLKTQAITNNELVIGQYNVLPRDCSKCLPAERLFVVGNGLSNNERSDAFVINKDGKTGIGSIYPQVLFQVVGAGDELGGVTGFDEVVAYFNNDSSTLHTAMSLDAELGRDAIFYLAEDSAAVWDLRHDANANSDFNIRYHGGAGNDTKLRLDVSGNLHIDGTLFPSSDVHRKHLIDSINENEILNKVSALPIKSWSYKGEEIPHIGPMAQDFYAAFGYGNGETTIATVDADGIALAAINALSKKLHKQEELIVQLQEQIAKLESKK